MKRLTVSVGLVVLLSVSVWADYLELSRGALLKAAPSANAETKEQLSPPMQLTLLEDQLARPFALLR